MVLRTYSLSFFIRLTWPLSVNILLAQWLPLHTVQLTSHNNSLTQCSIVIEFHFRNCQQKKIVSHKMLRVTSYVSKTRLLGRKQTATTSVVPTALVKSRSWRQNGVVQLPGYEMDVWGFVFSIFFEVSRPSRKHLTLLWGPETLSPEALKLDVEADPWTPPRPVARLSCLNSLNASMGAEKENFK
jgi:hypothetical protein